MALRDWLAQGRVLTHLKDISYSLKRIANAMEERNLSGERSGLGLRTLYEDKGSSEDADLLNMSDEDYFALELLEIQKRKNSGEAQDLSDEEVEGVIAK